MSTKNFKMYAIAAVIALTAAVAAAAPAFAWGSGAPTSSYDQAAHGHYYYDYYQGR
jgi:hypothetical protein